MFKRLKQLFQHKPKCNCYSAQQDIADALRILQENGGEERNPNCEIHGDAAMMNHGHCPDCQGTSFMFGPNCGVGTIVTCEGCGAQFLVEVLDDGDPAKIVYWGRTHCIDCEK